MIRLNECSTSSSLVDRDEISKRILAGEVLLLAGFGETLEKLPKGSWIGGTIPYLISDGGRIDSRDQVFATSLSPKLKSFKIISYNSSTLGNIYADAPENGFSVLIIPGMSPTHFSFALNAPSYPGFATRPVAGWITGVPMPDVGKISTQVFDGSTGTAFDDCAVVMHVALPDGIFAEIGIVNIFEPVSGDVITVEKDGFSHFEAFVNGVRTPFAKYLLERKPDLRHPLVANYHGAMVNSSFQRIDRETGEVRMFAPLFRGIQYRFANANSDQRTEFEKHLPYLDECNLAFSCNCILNEPLIDLEKQLASTITGPVTFGEIAYQLLNQTLVYVSLHETKKHERVP